MKNKTFSWLDRFLYKLLISVFILFGLVMADKFELINIDNIKEKLSENINVLKVIKTMNGNINILSLGTSEELEVTNDIYEYIEIDGAKHIKTSNMVGVKAHIAGVVIKIKKDTTYEVTIQGIDDKIYVYENIESIDCNIYSFIKTDEIIGRSSVYYSLTIDEKD